MSLASTASLPDSAKNQQPAKDTELLIKQAAAGNQYAFNELCAFYYQDVRRFVTYFLGSSCHAEDAVQEVFTALITSLKRYKFQAAFKTYLFAIARNTSRKFLKKIVRENKNRSLARTIPDPRPSSGEKHNMHTEKKRLNQALGRLNSKYREPLLLRELENMSYEEIATTLCLKTGTVKSRINTAKKKMLVLLNNRSK
ncbi:MAG TPA: RNA polymerase sigma factor [Spirochaetota bacterium]|nr:RNA polymerase sigma factor [Spirochaetota bacterium]